MKYFNLILFLFASNLVWSQEVISPLTSNPHLLKKSKIWKANADLRKSGEMLELPFIDDFSVDRFPGNEGGYIPLWENRTATRNTGWGKNPPTLGVVSLDGADEVGYPYSWAIESGPADTLLSCPIDLTANPGDGIGISFYFQPKGNNPNLNYASDSLMLEFYAPDLDEWFLVWSTSDISDPDNFTFNYISISQDKYLKEGFQFRFTNISPLYGAVETWNLDYIWLDQNSTNSNSFNNDVAFARQENSLLDVYSVMPRDHYAVDPVGFMRSNIEVLLRNLNNGPRTMEGNEIRILYEGNEVGLYPNPNEPGIAAGATLNYLHNVANPPNNIVFDPSLDEENLQFEVQILHGVSDFSPTSSNDTMRFNQKFFTEYGYDDASAEYSYAVGGSGSSLAMRYQNYKSDSIFALSIYTIPINYDDENSAFSIKIWEDSGDGPGAEIASRTLTVNYGVEEYQESWIYTFIEPVFIPLGSFFIGFTQTNQEEGVKIGMDSNTNRNEGNLYFRDSPSWSASSQPGSLMMRPMFTSNGYQDVIAANDELSLLKGIKVYPNPAQDYVYIQARTDNKIEVSIFDISGRMLIQNRIPANGRLEISQLNSGVYILLLEDESGKCGSKKLIVNK